MLLAKAVVVNLMIITSGSRARMRMLKVKRRVCVFYTTAAITMNTIQGLLLHSSVIKINNKLCANDSKLGQCLICFHGLRKAKTMTMMKVKVMTPANRMTEVDLSLKATKSNRFLAPKEKTTCGLLG